MTWLSLTFPIQNGGFPVVVLVYRTGSPYDMPLNILILTNMPAAGATHICHTLPSSEITALCFCQGSRFQLASLHAKRQNRVEKQRPATVDPRYNQKIWEISSLAMFIHLGAILHPKLHRPESLVIYFSLFQHRWRPVSLADWVAPVVNPYEIAWFQRLGREQHGATDCRP